MSETDSSLGRKAVHASIWSSAGKFFQLIFQLVIFAVLARLLGPRPFGIVSLAAAFIDFLLIVGRGGITEVLVRRQSVTIQEESTAFWTTLMVGLFMSGVTLVISFPISSAYHIPELRNVIIGLSPTCILTCLSSSYEARLRREFRFKLLATRNAVSVLVAGCVALVSIFMGFGIYSLVLQRLVSSALMFFTMAARAGWKPTFEFSASESGRQLRQGSGIVGCELLGVSNQKVIDLIIGTVLGPTALGYLRISWRALDILEQISILAFIPVALSTFSKLAPTRAQLRASYIRIVEATSLIMYPLCGGIIVFSGEFIHIVFGDKWNQSILPMQILSITGFIVPLFYYNGTALIALGETRKVLIVNAVEFIISAACAALMAEKGLIWAAASNVVRSIIFVPISLWMMWRHTGLPMSASLKASWKPAAATLVLAAVAVTTRSAAASVLPRIPAALIAGGLGVIAYAIAIWSMAPDTITALILRSPFRRIVQRLGLHERTPRRA